MPELSEFTQLGTAGADSLTGTSTQDMIAGRAGDDTVTGGGQGDQLFGDYSASNQLDGTGSASSFAEYGATGHWQVEELAGGHQAMTQTVATEAGGVYEFTFEIAANFAAGVTSAGVEILIDGQVVATAASSSGAFGEHQISFTAQGSETALTVRSIEAEDDGSPVIDTSGPAFHYDQEMTINGQTVTVAAFAEGQANLYQVLNGTLHVFDTGSGTYQLAGSSGTVNVNAMGFNQQDNLLYAIAVGNGVDTLGNEVSSRDLMMIDAEGNSYRIGATPYRSWTGDFDDQGNLWYFDSRMNYIAVVDVDAFDANGDPLTAVHKLPPELVSERFYDVAYNAATQSFTGIARPPSAGAQATLLTIDVSSGAPEFSTIPVTGTVIDGTAEDGVPYMTFGAAIYDADGTLYVGGNAGDHDMNGSTARAGGIYQVNIDESSGTASLELVSAAPKSYSNDGAADPRALSPFAQVDLTASVLIRDLSLVATEDGELSFNDALYGEAGADSLEGGLGTDLAVGGGRGDDLDGGSGEDSLYGGAGPGAGASGIQSVYDDDGLRYDQNGNILAEDDDSLSGGAGEDFLSGSAGHDTLDGGSGNDVLSGGSGFDVLLGGEGDDSLAGGSERDTLSGNSGDDTLSGGSGDDQLNGGDGADDLKGGSGADQMAGGTESDTLAGGTGDDTLSGGQGQDFLNGGKGNDVLAGGDGADRLNGGSGNDVLTGGAGKDYLNGGSGDDQLDGGEGRDRLYLGAGSDTAAGGGGADRFVFRTADLDGSVDYISDFATAQGDRLDLRQLDLASDDSTARTWFAANVSLDGSGGAQVDLGGGTLMLQNLGLTAEEELVQLYDAFLFH